MTSVRKQSPVKENSAESIENKSVRLPVSLNEEQRSSVTRLAEKVCKKPS